MRIEPWALPACERGHDAGPCGPVIVARLRRRRAKPFLLPISQTDAIARCPLQFAPQVWSRTEHKGLNEWQLTLSLPRLLSLEERSEFFGFAIRRNNRTVRGAQVAIRLPGPGAGIPAQTPRATLDFNEEEALRGTDEQIDFVDAAIIGNKLEVRPGAIGLVGGKLITYKLQRIPLPGILRLGYRNPILGDVHSVYHKHRALLDGSKGRRFGLLLDIIRSISQRNVTLQRVCVVRTSLPYSLRPEPSAVQW